jgi:hypothetical protein
MNLLPEEILFNLMNQNSIVTRGEKVSLSRNENRGRLTSLPNVETLQKLMNQQHQLTQIDKDNQILREFQEHVMSHYP